MLLPFASAPTPFASSTVRGKASFNNINFTVVKGVVNTIQNIDTHSSPTFSDLTISTKTPGYVVFFGAGGILSQSVNNLFWDNVNFRLGVGIISSLASALHVYTSTITDGISIDGNTSTALTMRIGGVSKGYFAMVDGSGHWTAGSAVNDTVIRSDAANILFSVDTGTSTLLYLSSANRIGLGLTSSITAKLHITAGSTAASSAPLKFNSGSLMTTAEAGAKEYNGNHYYTNAAIRFPVGGALFDHFADAGNNIVTGETDLYSDTTAANTLNGNGDKICFNYAGIFVAHASATREVKVYFAGSVILDSTALTTTSAENWEIEGFIIRESSTVVRCEVTFIASTSLGAKLFSEIAYIRLTGLTLSGTNILKITGQAGIGGSTNDVVSKLGFVEFKPAA